MLRVENVRERLADGAVVDIQVSTTSDLPDLHDLVSGTPILAGSIAQCIQDGKWYTLDEDGSWYDRDGNEA